MTPLVLLLLLAQPPVVTQDVTVAVYLEQGTRLSEARREALLQRISAILATGGIPLRSPGPSRVLPAARFMGGAPAACRGERACLKQLGRKLGVSHVVVVEAGEVSHSLAVVLDAVATSHGGSVLRRGFVVPSSGAAALKAEVARFTDTLRTTLDLPPPPEVLVTPVGR